MEGLVKLICPFRQNAHFSKVTVAWIYQNIHIYFANSRITSLSERVHFYKALYWLIIGRRNSKAISKPPWLPLLPHSALTDQFCQTAGYIWNVREFLKLQSFFKAPNFFWLWNYPLLSAPNECVAAATSFQLVRSDSVGVELLWEFMAANGCNRRQESKQRGLTVHGADSMAGRKEEEEEGAKTSA